MVEDQQNERLTRVGPGTPGGEMLRRYWFPVATESQLKAEEVHRVRLLGEDLVLFRDGKGRLGLVAKRCTHRGASLGYGFPEAEGLRCPYHGWLFNTEGDCLDTPNQAPDSPRFRSNCGVAAYKAQALGGLIFAYMGPSPAPAIPPYDLLVTEETPTRFRDIGYAVIPCNWLQIMENSFDPLHVEWLHGRLFDYHLVRAGQEPTLYSGHHVKLGFDVFEHGIIKRRFREGQSELEEDWTVGHPVVFPNLLKVGGVGLAQFQIRTPIDDEHVLHFWYTLYDVPEGYEDVIARTKQIPDTYVAKLQGPDDSFLMDTIDSQDAMAWVTQGAITNRSDEHLCASDRGVVLYRNQVEEQIVAVENGKDPLNVFSPEEAPAIIDLPMEQKDVGLGGGSDNPLASFLRTQSRYSDRVTQAVHGIDQILGLPERENVSLDA